MNFQEFGHEIIRQILGPSRTVRAEIDACAFSGALVGVRFRRHRLFADYVPAFTAAYYCYDWGALVEHAKSCDIKGAFFDCRRGQGKSEFLPAAHIPRPR